MNDFKIITLCGSVKFKKQFIEIQEYLTNNGNIVFTPCLFSYNIKYKNDIITDDILEIFHKIHNTKIESSDCILVVDVDNYIGESTKREIEYAKSLNKQILYYSNYRKDKEEA